MEKFELIAPCHFGMEAVLKREILDLGYEITKVEDGKVTFEADAQGIADANIFLRSTERILLKVAEVKAETFDELFEKTKALPVFSSKFWFLPVHFLLYRKYCIFQKYFQFLLDRKSVV